MLDEAFRALVCGAHAECELIVESPDPNGPRLDITMCCDEIGALPALAQAIQEERPFEVVVMGSSWLGFEAPQSISAVLSADPNLYIVAHGDRLSSLPEEMPLARVTFVPSQADAISLRHVLSRWHAAAVRSAHSPLPRASSTPRIAPIEPCPRSSSAKTNACRNTKSNCACRTNCSMPR